MGPQEKKKWEIEIYEGGIKVGKNNIFPERGSK